MGYLRNPQPMKCHCGCGEDLSIEKRDHRVRYAKGHKPRNISVVVNLETGCWMWQNFRNKLGYGMAHDRCRSTPAHRWVYEATYGPIPEGLVLDHKCRNPSCVNPEHMRPTTQAWNVRFSRATKINADQARSIKTRRLAGEKLRSLAGEFGLSQQTICDIAKGRIWNGIHVN